MFHATKIRLYPNAAQQDLIARQLGCVRFVWNKALDVKKVAWRERRESLSIHTLITMLPVWKARDYPWLKEADSQALQMTLRHLDRAYTNFFAHRARFPKFKKKHAPRQSYAYPQRVKVEGDKVFLPKVGWVKAVVHREITGAIKTVTVSRSATGKYYAAVLTEDGKTLPEPVRPVTRVTGIDLGLNDAVIASHGAKTPNPRFLRRSLKNLRRKQQSLSRKIEAAKTRCAAAGRPVADLRDYFGSNVAQARQQLARAHERVRDARTDWQHQVSRRLADETQAVCAETLNVQGMMKNRRLARAIADVGWSGLVTKLEAKLKARGGYLIRVDRFFPSTQLCSRCGAKNAALTLKDRTWTCAACGTTHDRDVNAAINIRHQGILQLNSSCPERKTFSLGHSRRCEKIPVPRPAYTARVSISSMARAC
ncbi:MAG: RNA-guided endonuclease TnpB family protein, partial [Acidiferrobacter thiooxydans]